MDEITLKDLKLLLNLSQIFNIMDTTTIKIQKNKKNGVMIIVDTELNRNLISVDYIDTNVIRGSYYNALTGATSEYSIKQIFNDILLFEYSSGNNSNMKLLTGNSDYGCVGEILRSGVKVIQLSSIADFQILTNAEREKGQQLVKQYVQNDEKNS